jgi:hypothetical protein
MGGFVGFVFMVSAIASYRAKSNIVMLSIALELIPTIFLLDSGMQIDSTCITILISRSS